MIQFVMGQKANGRLRKTYEMWKYIRGKVEKEGSKRYG